MNIDEIRALLDRYQKGSCTDEERKAIEAWYDSLRLGENYPLREQDLEASLARVRGNLRDLTGEGRRLTGGEEEEFAGEGREGGAERWAGVGRLGEHRIWRVGVAAAIVLFVAGSLWWFRAFRREGAGESAADSSITVVTGRGETRQVILPDGSTLLLNAATVFRYPKHFGRADRTVNLLKGEVFLQVVAQPGSPFVVVNGSYRTKVLGTSFDIRDYEEERAMRIAVLTGKVCVSEEGRDGAVLEKGMLLQVGKGKAGDKGADNLAVDNFDNDYDVAAWKEGAFNFKDASFGEIAFEIGNRYNVGLVNKSKKQFWSYTGLFRSESLQEVVETICQTENLGYIFSDNAILIVDK
jgi:ferric-dicitrate binding protein FerR (iron transport regulator)